MPADHLTDAARMVGCGLAVAAVALPVGLTAWAVARRAGTPLLPRPRPLRVPWTGFEVIVGFLALNAVVPGLVFEALSRSGFYQHVYGPDFPPAPTAPAPPPEVSAAVAGAPVAVGAADQQAELAVVRGLWTGVVALPVQLALLLFLRAAVYPAWRSPATVRTLPARVALAVAGWAVVTPVVLGVHAGVNLAFDALGWRLEEHPLSRLSPSRPVVDRVLFLLQAGVTTPILEEVLFRGLLFGWLAGGRGMLDPPPNSNQPRPAPDRRVWTILAVTLLTAAFTGRGAGEWLAGPTRGPVLFAIVLALGWVALRFIRKRKRRSVGAVYASAALFAVVHSSVWPTPLPLFVLGLGLGWLALRTRGILAPVIVHGLFNAVSVLFVLRGG